MCPNLLTSLHFSVFWQNYQLTEQSFLNCVRGWSIQSGLGIFCSLRIWWFVLLLSFFSLILCSYPLYYFIWVRACCICSNCILYLILSMELKEFSSRILHQRRSKFSSRIFLLTFLRYTEANILSWFLLNEYVVRSIVKTDRFDLMLSITFSVFSSVTWDPVFTFLISWFDLCHGSLNHYWVEWRIGSMSDLGQEEE